MNQLPKSNSLPPAVTVETTPITCGRCQRTFSHWVIEEAVGFEQLRGGELLVTNVEANCPDCGFIFRWKINEKNVGKMLTTYQHFIARYSPE